MNAHTRLLISNYWLCTSVEIIITISCENVVSTNLLKVQRTLEKFVAKKHLAKKWEWAESLFKSLWPNPERNIEVKKGSDFLSHLLAEKKLEDVKKLSQI